MSDLPISHDGNLVLAAKFYHQKGWSVIPIIGDGDPKRAKAPAIAWSDYQYRLPTESELDEWFGEKRYARNAVGIVCGAVSSLAVLDFDDPTAAESFARTCPDLTHTMTVRSGGRGLPHYYFHVPRGQVASSKRVRGADFQSGGTYVVAPPSQINGHKWEQIVDLEPRTLSRADVVRIHKFLDTLDYVQSGAIAAAAADNDVPLQSVTHVTDSVFIKSEDTQPSNSVTHVTLSDLYRWYQSLARRLGRNAALFRVAVYVRDAGWSLVRCIRELLDWHIAQPANGDHAHESPDQRRHEGLMTLRSAFSRAMRPKTPAQLEAQSHKIANIRTLPNVLRERLLQLGLVSVARVLDGLLMVGVGRRFTEKLATTLLAPFKIGRRTIMAALGAKIPLQPPVEETDTDPDPGMSFVGNEANQQQKCFFVRGAERVKSGGRPAVEYVMPDVPALCQSLGVSVTLFADRLHPIDLCSPTAYRQALQRAFIQRRPGVYAQMWMAARIGVSKWTLRRYNRVLGLRVEPRYEETPITWRTLDALFAEEPRRGTFIETSDGKRYPPVRGIAARLLKRGIRATIKHQLCNYYETLLEEPVVVSDEVVSADTEEEVIAPVVAEVERPVKHDVHYCADCITATIHTDKPCKRCGGSNYATLSREALGDVEQTKRVWGALWNAKHPPKSDTPVLNTYQQMLADDLYLAVRRASSDESQWLAHTKACQLVAEHPANRIEWALYLLRSRRNLNCPAGFAIAVITGKRKDRAPKRSGDLLEQIATSPYLQFFANADQIVAMYNNRQVVQ